MSDLRKFLFHLPPHVFIGKKRKCLIVMQRQIVKSDTHIFVFFPQNYDLFFSHLDFNNTSIVFTLYIDVDVLLLFVVKVIKNKVKILASYRRNVRKSV